MKSAFIIVDVQKAWAQSNPQTTRAIRDAADRIRRQMPVIWVYMRWPDMREPFPAGDLARSRYTNIFNRCVMEECSEEGPLLVPSREDWVIPKDGTSLFSNPEAKAFFDRQGIRRLIFSGYMTSQCVFDSARAAVGHGFVADAVSNLMADSRDSSLATAMDRFAAAGINVIPAGALGL